MHSRLASLSALLSLSLAPACSGGGDDVDLGPDAGRSDPDGADPIDAPAGNQPGTYLRQLDVGGLTRELIVYVPASAAGTTPVPAVLMFHGTSGDGERFYNISGWRQKAHAVGPIAVFPSALIHCFHEDEYHDGDIDDPGERKVTSKWASGQLGTATMPLCTAAEIATLSPTNQARVDHPLADDLAFTDAMLDLLASDYAVDAHRLYASGFSNGGGMTSRLALERADRFAATAAAAGGLKPDPAPAARSLSAVLSLGAIDDRFTTPYGVTEIPITATVFDEVPALRLYVAPYLAMLQLDPTFTFTTQTVNGKLVGRYQFTSSPVGATNRLEFVLIEDLGHQYPNGSNHPVVMTDLLWPFFASQTLP